MAKMTWPLAGWDPMIHKSIITYALPHFIREMRIMGIEHDCFRLEMALLMKTARFNSIHLLFLLPNLQLHPNCNYQALNSPPTLIAAATPATATSSVHLRTPSTAPHAAG